MSSNHIIPIHLEKRLMAAIQEMRRPGSNIRFFKVELNVICRQFELVNFWKPVVGDWKHDYLRYVHHVKPDPRESSYIVFRLDTMNDLGFFDWLFICFTPVEEHYEKRSELYEDYKLVLDQYLSPSIQHRLHARYAEQLEYSYVCRWLVDEQRSLFNSIYRKYRTNPYGFMPDVLFN